MEKILTGIAMLATLAVCGGLLTFIGLLVSHLTERTKANRFADSLRNKPVIIGQRSPYLWDGVEFAGKAWYNVSNEANIITCDLEGWVYSWETMPYWNAHKRTFESSSIQPTYLGRVTMTEAIKAPLKAQLATLTKRY